MGPELRRRPGPPFSQDREGKQVPRWPEAELTGKEEPIFSIYSIS